MLYQIDKQTMKKVRKFCEFKFRLSQPTFLIKRKVQ